MILERLQNPEDIKSLNSQELEQDVYKRQGLQGCSEQLR